MFAPILYSNLFGPSFFSYYISMSVIAQCLVFISVSAFADYGSGRKMFFIGFSVIGCICTSLMSAMEPPLCSTIPTFPFLPHLTKTSQPRMTTKNR
jgi:MFS-type transporter involved in bile tolerance (Atg22 family)